MSRDEQIVKLVQGSERGIQDAWINYFDAVGADAVQELLDEAQIQKPAQMRRVFIRSVFENCLAAFGETMATTAAIVGAAYNFTGGRLNTDFALERAIPGAFGILIIFLTVEVFIVYRWWLDFTRGPDVARAVRSFYERLTWLLPILGIVFYFIGTWFLATLIGVVHGGELAGILLVALVLSATGSAIFYLRLSIATEVPTWLPHVRVASKQDKDEVENIRSSTEVMQFIKARLNLNLAPVYLVYLLAQGLWGFVLAVVVLAEVWALGRGTVSGLVTITFSASLFLILLSHGARLVRIVRPDDRQHMLNEADLRVVTRKSDVQKDLPEREAVVTG